MKQTIQHEKYGEILYQENFWTGKKSLTVGGVALTRMSRRDFQMPDGTNATVTGGFLQGASLVVGGETIRLTPRIAWYKILLCIVPFLLVTVWGNVTALCLIVPVVGGGIGGGVSALMSCLSLFVMKTVKPVWAKILIGIAFIGAAFGVCCGIGCAIVAAAI